MEAFSADGPRDPPETGTEVTDSLMLAAGGVLAERTGDREHALDCYDRIAGGDWDDLLRACLRGWSTLVEGTDDIAAAHEMVERLEVPDDLRARLSASSRPMASTKRMLHLQSEPCDLRLPQARRRPG